MNFNAFLADIRLMCPGMPEPWQYRFLTRSLQRFLSYTELWKEWTEYNWDFDIASAGRYVVPNSKYDPSGPTDNEPLVRTNRVHEVQWVPTGRLLTRSTMDQVVRNDPDAMERTGRDAQCWWVQPSGYGDSSVPAVQVSPYPAVATDETTGALRFYVSHTITEVETPEQVYELDFTLANSGVADWVYRRYRETIVAGALANALIVPNVDWSQPRLAMTYAAGYAEGEIRAKGEGDAGHTNAYRIVSYGGY